MLTPERVAELRRQIVHCSLVNVTVPTADLRQLLAAAEDAKRMREALEYYADLENWTSAAGMLGESLDGFCGAPGDERAWVKAKQALALTPPAKEASDVRQ